MQPLNGPTGWIRFLDAFVEDLQGNTTNIYPWKQGDNAYSTPQNDLKHTILATADATGNNQTTFTGVLKDDDDADGVRRVPSEGTIFVEISDGATWTKIAEADRGGVLHALSSAYKVMGVVNPKTQEFVINITDSSGTAIKKALRFVFKEDIQKNIPFGTGKTYNTMRFEITKIAVEAKTRKLGATYSFELMEDYKKIGRAHV